MATTKPYTDGSGAELVDEIRELRNDHNGLALHVGSAAGELRRELASQEAGLRAELDALRRELAQLSGELQALQGQANGIEGDIRIMRYETRDMRGDVDDLRRGR